MAARRLALIGAALLGLVSAAQAQGLPAGVRVEPVSLPDGQSKIRASLQQDLDQIGFPARIAQCELVLDYFDDRGSGRDSSYGAVGDLSLGARTIRLTMCDDWLIGRFTLRPGSMTADRLGRFIADNCPPGA